MDPLLPNELTEMIFIKLLANDPAAFWVLARVTRWSLRVAIKYQQRYSVKDINLERILPRLARYMPNLEQLCVVPSKRYFYSCLSDTALKTLLKFTRLTYLDTGHADTPKMATLLATLTQLRCIDTAAHSPDVTGVTPSSLAHLRLDHPDRIRKWPITSFMNLRRVSLKCGGDVDVAEIFSEPLRTVTQLSLHTREPQQLPNLAIIFPNLESIDFGCAQLTVHQSALRSLTRLTAVRALKIQPKQLQGVKLRSLTSSVDDVSQFSEFTCLTALNIRLATNHPSLVNLAALSNLERLKLRESGKDFEFNVGSRLTRVTLAGERSTPWTAFTDVQRLTLDYVPIYTARELRHLTQMTRLNLKRCIALDPKSLLWLASLPSLCDLTWQNVTDEGLHALSTCPALTALHLRHGTVSGTSLSPLHQLRRLVLSQVAVNGEYLSQLYHLEQLKLEFDKPTEVDVTAIQTASCNNSLTALVLRGALLDEVTMRTRLAQLGDSTQTLFFEFKLNS